MPLPHRWATWKFFNNSGKAFLTSLLTFSAPRLPPVTIITGLLAEKPHISSAVILLPSNNSLRIGEPVCTALEPRYAAVSGKL